MTQELPAFASELLARQYGESQLASIMDGYAAQRHVSLRANALLSSREQIAAALNSAGIAFSQPAWYPDAFVISDPQLRERPIWELPEYAEGKLYLQSLSSMLPPLMLGLGPGLDVLDMCAAPGGKTTQMAAIGGRGCHISACEMSQPRAEKLQFNLDRQGARNVTLMRCDARKLDEFFRFDRILLDAPCSGSGTLSLDDPKLGKRFNRELLDNCRRLQAGLMAKALKLLKPGGRLLYSTCSIFADENENQVRAALAKASGDKNCSFELLPLSPPTAALAGLDELPLLPCSLDDLPLLPCSLEGALCVRPDEYYEGFFMALIQRVR